MACFLRVNKQNFILNGHRQPHIFMSQWITSDTKSVLAMTVQTDSAVLLVGYIYIGTAGGGRPLLLAKVKNASGRIGIFTFNIYPFFH